MWTSYLPSVFQKAIDPLPNAAVIKIREDQKKGYVCASFKDETTVLALTLQGHLYEYRYDAKARTCSLVEENSLITAGSSEALKAEMFEQHNDPAAAED
jgi:hypothetical protein